MLNNNGFNIDDETINKVGLKLSERPITAEIVQNGRVFEYPHLDNVYIMESDLYGNPMPKNSCFLAFYGKHGLIGEDLSVETLRNASVDDIKKIVEADKEG